MAPPAKDLEFNVFTFCLKFSSPAKKMDKTELVNTLSPIFVSHFQFLIMKQLIILFGPQLIENFSN
jgi:hypothetical protein